MEYVSIVLDHIHLLDALYGVYCQLLERALSVMRTLLTHSHTEHDDDAIRNTLNDTPPYLAYVAN